MHTIILLAATAVGQPVTPATPPQAFHSPAPVAAKGDVKAGPPLVHTFDLVHNGTGIVTITKIEAGCGCLRQALGTNVLQPGERTKLALEVKHAHATGRPESLANYCSLQGRITGCSRPDWRIAASNDRDAFA